MLRSVRDVCGGRCLVRVGDARHDYLNRCHSPVRAQSSRRSPRPIAVSVPPSIFSVDPSGDQDARDHSATCGLPDPAERLRVASTQVHEVQRYFPSPTSNCLARRLRVASVVRAWTARSNGSGQARRCLATRSGNPATMAAALLGWDGSQDQRNGGGFRGKQRRKPPALLCVQRGWVVAPVRSIEGEVRGVSRMIASVRARVSRAARLARTSSVSAAGIRRCGRRQP